MVRMTNGTTPKPWKWINKSIYLEKVSGLKIIEEQEKLNSGSTFVVATQIIPLTNQLTLRADSTTHQAYDAFIYYKEKVDLEADTPAKYEEIIEDKETMNIVVP